MTFLVLYVALFIGVGIFFVFFHLMLGKIVRPAKPETEKLTIYECGEPTIGSAWVQFDLRYYVIALLFVIFDVEVAFFFPWAVVFGHATTLAKQNPAPAERALAQRELLGGADENLPEASQDTRRAARDLAWLAFADIGVFFGVLLVGFAYLWKRGDLDWVRSIAAERPAAMINGAPQTIPEHKELAHSV